MVTNYSIDNSGSVGTIVEFHTSPRNGGLFMPQKMT
jgi:hypothetical protein